MHLAATAEGIGLLLGIGADRALESMRDLRATRVGASS